HAAAPNGPPYHLKTVFSCPLLFRDKKNLQVGPSCSISSAKQTRRQSWEKREPSRDGRKPARVHNKSGTDEPIRPTGNVLPCEPFFSDLSSGTSTSRLRRAHGPPLLEAFPAKDRPPLGRPEGNGGFLSAL